MWVLYLAVGIKCLVTEQTSYCSVWMVGFRLWCCWWIIWVHCTVDISASGKGCSKSFDTFPKRMAKSHLSVLSGHKIVVRMFQNQIMATRGTTQKFNNWVIIWPWVLVWYCKYLCPSGSMTQESLRYCNTVARSPVLEYQQGVRVKVDHQS
jgi:hypothetical protein